VSDRIASVCVTVLNATAELLSSDHPGQDAPQVDAVVATLILADPHQVTLAGIEYLADAETDLRTVARCTSARETLEAVDQHPSATLVIDLHLPPDGAFAVLRQLDAGRRSLPIVLLAGRISDREMLDAMRIGVRGVALKDMSPRLIIECIRHVARGETWIETATFAAIVERAIQDDLRMQELRRRLTRRELHVLDLVADGRSNKEITSELNIADGTLKIHLHHIYRKIGVKDRRQLAQSVRGETA